MTRPMRPLAASALYLLGEQHVHWGGPNPLGLAILLGLPLLWAGAALLAKSRRKRILSWRLARSLPHLALPLFGLAVLGFGWVAEFEAWLGHAQLFRYASPWLLLGLAPYLLVECLGPALEQRVTPVPGGDPEHPTRQHAQLVLAGTIPLFLYLAMGLVASSHAPWRVWVEQVALVRTAYLGLWLLLCLLLVPHAILGSLHLRTDPWLTKQWAKVQGMGRQPRSGVHAWLWSSPYPEASLIYTWPKGHQVLISEELRRRLDAEELEAVLAHEAGHRFHRHGLFTVAASFVLVASADLLLLSLPSSAQLQRAATITLAILSWASLFGYLVRRLELQADLFSARQMRGAHPLNCALERLGADSASWRYFSRERRGRLSGAMFNSPPLGLAFDRHLQRAKGLCFGLAALLLVAHGTRLLRQFPTDHIKVLLGQGHYAAAIERAGSLPKVSAALEGMLEKAGHLVDTPNPQSLLAHRRQEAVGSGAWQDALDWTRLAILEGQRGLHQELRQLENQQ